MLTDTESTQSNPPEESSGDIESTLNDESETAAPPETALLSEAKNLLTVDDDSQEPHYEPPTVVDLSDLASEDEYSADERAALESRYTETMKVFRTGEIVAGKIVSITENDVSVDIGFKSEGSISLEEFDKPEDLKVGGEIEVCIESIEDAEGTLVLSKKKAEFMRVWEKINEFYQTGEMVEGQIIKRIKGGMVVDLFGVEAFLPGSQIDVHPVRDFDAMVGATMDFRIIKVNNVRKNVVLSHKVVLEESLREIRAKVLAEIEEGQIVEGVVKNITDFGVFVDLGGVDGLLHITELSWGRVSHPSDVVSLDEKIQVKVLSYDKGKQRISLGLKQLKEHHWNEIETKFPVGSKTTGKVISIVKYGSFVEIAEGVEGLVHISEMSWTQHIKHPSQLVNVGDEVEVVILNIDKENRKISLGMKQVEEDPWEKLEDVYVPQSVHKGTVRDLVPFGAFVELESGIDGLIHISDLSWTRKVRHPGEIVKKGQGIEVVILNFDKNERRIALGYKQLEPDPWDHFEREYQIRSRTEGSILRILEKGIVVMLPLSVEGFVPNSQLGKSLTGDKRKGMAEGDKLELEVIEFDKTNHRIILSHSTIERSKERSTVEEYQESAEESITTIGDVMRVGDKTAAVDEVEADDDKPKKRRKTKKTEPAGEAAKETQPTTAEDETAAEGRDEPATESAETGDNVGDDSEKTVDQVEDDPEQERDPPGDDSEPNPPEIPDVERESS